MGEGVWRTQYIFLAMGRNVESKQGTAHIELDVDRSMYRRRYEHYSVDKGEQAEYGARRHWRNRPMDEHLSPARQIAT